MTEPNATPAMPAPPLSPTDPLAGDEEHRKGSFDVFSGVRASDVEPYVGLRYLSKLFRMIAILCALILILDLVTGLVRFGSAAIVPLLGSSGKLIIAAGLLWGAGDLALLMIDVGHDVRATRILLARQAAHGIAEKHQARRSTSMPDE